ncbi:hypothetical protein D3C73_911740 [compost metagenome]
MQAALQRDPDGIGSSTRGAAHQFDEDIDIGFGCKLFRCFKPCHAGHVEATVTVAVAGGNGSDLDRSSACHGQFIGTCLDDLNQRSTHGSKTRDADFEGVCHFAFPMFEKAATNGPLEDYDGR